MAKNSGYVEGTKVKIGMSDRIIRGVGYVLVSIYALACIIPFIIIVSTSFTSEATIRAEGVQLIPKDISLQAYEMVAKGGGIWWSYLLTIAMTLVGTFLGLSIIAINTPPHHRTPPDLLFPGSANVPRASSLIPERVRHGPTASFPAIRTSQIYE